METPRLALRELTVGDLDYMAPLYADPDIRRYFPEGLQTREETLKEMEWTISVSYAKHGFGLWATIHKETGDFIGRCGLIPWIIEGVAEVEVAYLLAKPFWGRGLATEIACGILDYGFRVLNLERIVCLPEPENAASVRVAEKAGLKFEREIVLDGTPASVFALSKGEWGGVLA